VYRVDNQKRRDSVTQQQLLQLDQGLRAAFSKVKEEFEEHLQAINENTDEINASHDALGELDGKMEKLNARIDTIHMMFQQLLLQTRVSVELGLAEQRVFSLLYLHPYVPLIEMGVKTSLSQNEVEDILTSLADKGVVIVRRVKDGETYLKLDDDFRRLQEQYQMVKVSPAIMQQVENKALQSFFT